jgi:hypothetical protein
MVMRAVPETVESQDFCFFPYEFSVDPPRSAKTRTARPPSPIGSRRIRAQISPRSFVGNV